MVPLTNPSASVGAQAPPHPLATGLNHYKASPVPPSITDELAGRSREDDAPTGGGFVSALVVPVNKEG